MACLSYVWSNSAFQEQKIYRSKEPRCDGRASYTGRNTYTVSAISRSVTFKQRQLITLTNKANELKNRILQSLLRAGGSLGFVADNEERDRGFELSDSGLHTPARKRSGTYHCTEPSKKRALDFGVCSLKYISYNFNN